MSKAIAYDYWVLKLREPMTYYHSDLYIWGNKNSEARMYLSRSHAERDCVDHAYKVVAVHSSKGREYDVDEYWDTVIYETEKEARGLADDLIAFLEEHANVRV